MGNKRRSEGPDSVVSGSRIRQVDSNQSSIYPHRLWRSTEYVEQSTSKRIEKERIGGCGGKIYIQRCGGVPRGDCNSKNATAPRI